ncbi:MAG: hypothetical protein ACYSWU_13560, partial [Planctomycetota bacterium]
MTEKCVNVPDDGDDPKAAERSADTPNTGAVSNLPDETECDTGPTGGLEGDAPRDRFDPASLRLGQDFASTIGVKKVLTTVPCRKPNRHEFVRVRPGEDWRLETGVFEDRVNREVYLVQRDLWVELAGEVYPVCLFLAINRQGDV